MIRRTAVLTRVGFVLAAASLALVDSLAVRAEDPSPVEKNETATAGETKADSKTAEKKSTSAKSDGEASKSAGTEPEKKADKNAASSDKEPDDTAAAAKSAGTEPEKKTDKDTAASNKKADDTAASKSSVSEPEKKADKDAASAEKKGDETAASKSSVSEPEKKADKDAASTDKKADDTAAASKSVSEPEKKADKNAASTDKKADETAAASKSEPEKKTSAKPVSVEKKADDTAASKAAGTEPEKKADKDAASAEKTPAKPTVKVETTPLQEPAKPADKASPTPPKATAALPDASSDAQSASVADKVLPPADPIVAGIRQKIPDAVRGANEDDGAALAAFYDELNGPAIWVSSSGFTAKGKAVVAEIGKAEDWGLRASDFQVPHLSAGALSPDAAADAEIKVALTILKYARYARGGRINPASISQIIDQSPTLRAPKAVLTEIAAADAPDAYLRGLNPKHEQFEKLRQVLLKLRGSDGKEEEEPEDPALAVKLPPGGIIRADEENPQVTLLRQRLKVPTDDKAKENVYDKKLQEAVREFQSANHLRPDAIVGNNTRAVLNGRPKPQGRSAQSKIERILINMERWRWMPEDLGKLYVWDNVPEALTRIVKDGKIIHTDKIIVGQPTWPTPSFSADMKTVVFHPSWGVPDGIKRKELLPLLRKSSGAGFFGVFGGGYSSQAVLDAYELKVYFNGRPIDPNQVDWSSVDIRAFSFQQPPGPKNPLGNVKFMFPNKHDVYMHDTPERELFSRTFRALSHGCMRIQDPRRFAEIILGEDKGWSPEKVRSMFGSYSNDVALDTHIPVHVTYFTARVDNEGKLRTFGDFYGLDGRTAAALSGRNVRFEQPPVYEDESVASSEPTSGPAQRRRARKKQYSGPPTLADAISGLFSP